MRLFFAFYNFFFFILTPLLWVYAVFHKTPGYLRERFSWETVKRPDKKILWIHAASLGELKALHPLLEKIETIPEVQILITSSSRRSLQGIKKSVSNTWIHRFIPFDSPLIRKRFLQTWSPALVIWTESDLWPGFFYDIHARSIPLYLVNGKLSEKSFQRWSFLPQSFLSFFHLFDQIYAQSPESYDYYKKIGLNNVVYQGNLKFLCPAPRIEKSVVASFRQRMKRPHNWFAACTHPSESTFVQEVHTRLVQQGIHLTTVIAPRHPKHAPALQAHLEKAGFTTALHSSTAAAIEVDFYIVDTFGELDMFYQLFPFCLLGGSLAPIGGHAPIQALMNGCAVIVGPHIHSNYSLYQPFLKDDLIKVCATTDHVISEVIHRVKIGNKSTEYAKKTHQILQKEQKYAHNLINIMLKIVKSSLKNE